MCGKRAGRTSLYDDFLKKFFPKLANSDIICTENDATETVNTVNEILNEFKSYRDIKLGIWPYETQQPITEWDRKRLDVLINFLNFDIVYPILLAGTKLKEKQFSELVQLLEKFMFRYKTICNLSHQKISELFMSEAVKIRENPSSYRLSDLKSVLKKYIQNECPDTLFNAGLSSLKYKTKANNKTLKYLFSTLNEHIEWYSNGAQGKPKPHTATIINYDDVTVEHISSQSAETPLKEFSGDRMHSFYNLTILTRAENDKAKNKEFVDKKEIYADSSYSLNKYFSEIANWDFAEAENWESYLKEFACKVFVV